MTSTSIDRFPPQLSSEKEAILVKTIQDWSLANGLVLLSGDSNGGGIPAPVTIFPTPFPRSAFNEALEIQKAFNDIYHEVCKNEEWLLEELKVLAKYDPEFTGKLLDIHLKIQQVPGGPSQNLTGGLFRSDYIVHSKVDDDGSTSSQIKQVEFNTVSVSFGGLSSKLSKLHNYLIDANVYDQEGAELAGPTNTFAFDKRSVPISPSLEGLAAGLVKMHEKYVSQNSSNIANKKKVAILFVVQPGEKNALDQRLIEFELFNRYKILSFRVTLAEVEGKTTKQLRNNGGILNYTPTGSEISVVYYRSGYGPSDYPSETEWSARFYLESSHAIKCPSVLTQLSGAKKIQQLLTDEKILQQFSIFSPSTLSAVEEEEDNDHRNHDHHHHDHHQQHHRDHHELHQRHHRDHHELHRQEHGHRHHEHDKQHGQHHQQHEQTPSSNTDEQEANDINNRTKTQTNILVEKIKKSFVKIYPLDESRLGLEARKIAFESPERYVLKPQREGGGNNVYKENIPGFLNSIPKESWGAYILMELIEPAESKNKILRAGELYSGRIISELGIFGTVLWDNESETSLVNDVPGWLLRTKLETSNEGGVAAGFGCIDSVYLI